MIRRWMECRRLRRAWLRAAATHRDGQVPVLDSGPTVTAAPPAGHPAWWRALGWHPTRDGVSPHEVGSDRGHGEFDEIAVGQWLHVEAMSGPGDEEPGDPPALHHWTLHVAGWRMEVDVAPDGHGTLQLVEWDGESPPPPVIGMTQDPDDRRTPLLRDLDELDQILGKANRKGRL